MAFPPDTDTPGFEIENESKVSIVILPLCFMPGGGVHDLGMDGGLPPGFQKSTLL